MTGQPGRRIRVAVVFGGRSSEHAVSCATAAGVMAALDPDRYEVVPIGITTDGRWVLADGDVGRLALTAGHEPRVDGSAGQVVLPMGVHERALTVHEPPDAPRQLGEVDVVFSVLHGPFGEDGTIQGLFELSDVRYVGSGVLASAAGMDKHYMKQIFVGHGLPVGDYDIVTDRQWRTDAPGALRRLEVLGFPLFVKPCRAGSSMGITKVGSSDGLREAIELARGHDPKVIVEAAVPGRELECAVLEGRGTQEPRTSHVGEIEVLANHEFYDFEAKYLDDADVALTCPAHVPDEIAGRVRQLAAAAFDALGCEGLARVDCFYTPDGRVLVNEINTMPGFTPHSMYPRMWAASGVDYPDLVDELITLALHRRTGLR